MIQIIFAFFAGVLTVGAPCILPVLPIVLGASIGRENKMRPLFLTLGFILSFVFVSLAFSVVTRVLGFSQSNLRLLGIISLLIFGFFLLIPAIFERLIFFLNPYINSVSQAHTKYTGTLGGLMVGLSMGIIWTPCAGPILASILALIATTNSIVSASVLLTAYALGAALPMLLIAYGSQYITTRIKSFTKYSGHLQKVFGLLIIILAISMYFNYDLILQAYLAEYFPKISLPKY